MATGLASAASILKGPVMYKGLLRTGCIFCGPGIPAGKVVRASVPTLDPNPPIRSRLDVAKKPPPEPIGMA